VQLAEAVGFRGGPSTTGKEAAGRDSARERASASGPQTVGGRSKRRTPAQETASARQSGDDSGQGGWRGGEKPEPSVVPLVGPDSYRELSPGAAVSELPPAFPRAPLPQTPAQPPLRKAREDPGAQAQILYIKYSIY